MNKIFFISGNGLTSQRLSELKHTYREISYLHSDEEGLSAQVLDNLRAFDIKPISAKISQQTREDFFQVYLDLIGKVSGSTDSRIWHASNVCSRNRFFTGFANSLYCIYQLLNFYEPRNESGIVLAINFPQSFHKILLDAREKIKGTPEILLLAGRFTDRPYLQRLTGKFHLLKEFVAVSLRLFRYRSYYREIRKNFAEIYVVKSNAVPDWKITDEGYQDPFFGPLVDFLTKRGKSVMLLCNLVGYEKDILPKIAALRSVKIVPMECYIHWFQLLKAFLKLWTHKAKTAQPAIFLEIPITSFLDDFLYRKHNDISLYQYFHYEVIQNLCLHAHITEYIQTYENNPWERMCVRALRDFAPNVVVRGYHHNVVPHASQNLFRSVFESNNLYVPDQIYTVGTRARLLLQRYSSHKNQEIIATCAMRYRYLDAKKPLSRGLGKKILVAPEGQKEAAPMVDYVIENLKNHPDFEVIFRFHPLLPYEQMRRFMKNSIPVAANFKISQGNSVEQDISNSDFVMYWGSAVSLEAVSLGRPVIHYDMGGLYNFDPLFECPGLHYIVTDSVDLPAYLKKIRAISGMAYRKKQIETSKYINSYFAKTTPAKLSYFL